MGIYRGRVQDVLFLPVSVSLPYSPSQAAVGQRPRTPRRALVSLILDTGAKYCSLTPELVAYLDLPFRGPVRVGTHFGVGQTGLHGASFAFPGSSLSPLASVLVVALPMPSRLAAYQGVIGRNVLDLWENFYSGPRRRLAIRDTPSFWGWLFS
jgi:hypothetical protein